MNNISEILTSLGYKLTDSGQYFRTSAIYRAGDNPNSISVNKKTGNFYDFVENRRGTLEELVQLTLKLKNVSDASEFLKTKHEFIPYTSDQEIKIDVTKTFSNEVLSKIIKNHSYWQGRGISKTVIEQFEGGVINEGKLKGRYIFPIYGPKKEIIGFDGRDVTFKKKIKWKIIGPKCEFKYPLFLNHQIIKDKNEVILVESIGDMLSLWECGICNTIVLFGTEISLAVLNFLLKININKIIISLNNDETGSGAGNRAAEKAKNKLLRYFDNHQVRITFPPIPFNDWNEVLKSRKDLVKI